MYIYIDIYIYDYIYSICISIMSSWFRVKMLQHVHPQKTPPAGRGPTKSVPKDLGAVIKHRC